MKTLGDKIPPAFVQFYQGALYDRLLHGLILYFCAAFQHDALMKLLDRSRTPHMEGLSSSTAVLARMRELEEDHSNLRISLSQPKFFEALYVSLSAILCEAFEHVGKQADVDMELGRLFRGRHFNTAMRLHSPVRSVDSMTVTQIWSLKNETHNRSLHQKLISGLFEKPHILGVQVAAVSNSTLVSQAVSSPLVARSLLADPAERDALLAVPFTRKNRRPQLGGMLSGVDGLIQPSGASAATSVAFMNKQAKSLLATQGRGQGASAAPEPHSPLEPLLPSAATMVSPSIAAASSLAAAAGSAAPRSAAALKPAQSAIAVLPEAAGLPYDETYGYLCLLRRYVVYGPSLNLPTSNPAAVATSTADGPAGQVSVLSLSGGSSMAPSMQPSHLST
eukprot:gene5262-5497_t